MKLSKYALNVILGLTLSANVYAKEEINVNFKALEIQDLIKITSKIIDKNILMTNTIKGKVDFISNKPIYKDDILNLLIYVLESKGYTIVDNKGILRVLRLSDASKYNMPIYGDKKDINEFQMITQIFNIKYANVDYVSSKIRHFISKSAKLVTDKESNSMVVTDFVSNINTIKKVINMITKDSKKDIGNYQLKHIGGASALANLNSVAKTVFNQKILKEKVTILLNKDTNNLMFVGKKDNIDFLLDYVKKIDIEESLVENIVEVVYLKNAEAANVIKIITGIIKQKVYKNKADKPFVSTDAESNSIILMGPKNEIHYITELINKLDIDKQQVYVQARIIEVSESKTKEVGLKYGLMGGSTSNSGLLTFAANLGGNALAISPSVMGLDIPTIDKGLALGATINLLNQNGAADIISEPSLLCINNKESSIYVGETRSIKTGTTTTSGGNINDTYTREDIGLTLKVKPRISNGNKVLLDISTKVEDVAQTTTNDQPNTTKKDLVTTAIVDNGESIILGGYIKARTEYTVDKIPLLGDIPYLGALFRNKMEANDKINLVIIITPYIVPKTKDLSYVRNKLAQLKILEDKYTKDAVVRLQKAKIQSKENDLKRDLLKLELQESEKSVDDARKEFDNRDSVLKNNSSKTNEELLHEQRVNQILGI
ncbi:MAG: secretin N-terminal domain-containing protein [Campylobacterota bacterium]|nr:secretin N-terminal domain-containing protein [Campylobacterota bacterium]